MPIARSTHPVRAALVGALALALASVGALPAAAFEAPGAAFSGGASATSGSGLTQTWSTTGVTTLVGAATTAGQKGYSATLYSPSIATGTPSESVQTSVAGCPVGGTCSGLGTLTVTFSRPVVNPVIHFAGLGGSVGAVLFHATLTLTTPGLTISKVGTGANYKVTGSTVTAVDDKSSASCTTFAAPTTSTAVCGSFQLNGTVTTASFAIGAVSVDTSYLGTLTGGVDEYLVLATVDQDYGDAPASYDAGNAARAVVSNLRLGSTVTADNTSTLNSTTSPYSAASGATGDSDDGASPANLYSVATSYSTTVAISGATAAGQVCGWVDFNRNNVFDSGERSCQAVAIGQTSATLTWTGLTGLSAGPTYARFRVGYNTTQTQSPTGPSDSGEVEDYALSIVALATPTPAPDAPTTQQDVTVTFNPLTNDSSDPRTSLDPTSVRLLDPVSLAYGTTVTIPGEGTYTVNTTTGQVTFDPVPTFTGTATPVTYRVADAYGQTGTSTITPHVTPVVPVANNDTVSTAFQTPVTAAVLANDTAGEASSPLVPGSLALLDPGTGTYGSSVTVAGQGTYVVTGLGEVVFTPTPTFTGVATPVTYRVADDNGTTATATLTVTVGPPPPPAPADDSAMTPQGVPVTLGTLGNDTLSPLGAALVPSSVQLQNPATGTFGSSVSVPGEGTWSVNPTTGAVTFTPETSFVGVATPITYRVGDANGGSATAVERVTVSPVVPTAIPDSTTTPYETPVTVQVVDNDLPGDVAVPLNPASVQIQDPSDGQWKTIVTTADGLFLAVSGGVGFMPTQGFTGVASLPYRVADANGTYAQSLVSVTVSNPAAPVAQPDTTTTDQGVAVTVDLIANDSSDPAAPLNPTTVRLLDGATPVMSLTVPGEGTYVVDPVSGHVTFTPLPSFSGTATPIGYRVADEAGQLATSTLTVTVTAVTPIAAPDAATTPYLHPVTFPLLSNDTAGAITAPLDPTSVQLQDPADSTWKTSVAIPGVGTYDVVAGGSVTFTPASGYSGTTADLPYRVTDSNGTYAQSTLHVTVGAAPVANPDAGSTPQGIAVTVPTLTNDTPGSGASLVPSSVQLLDPADSTYKASVTLPGVGSYAVDGAGVVTFTPLPAYTGTAPALGYRVTDSDSNTATSTITVVVSPVTPVANPDSGSTPYETPVTVDLTGNDVPGDPGVAIDPSTLRLIDPADGNPKTTVTLTGVGVFTAHTDGTLDFAPAQGYTGTTPSLTYQVTDANGTVASSTVQVVVGDPAAPVANPDTATTAQGVAVTLPALGNDTSDPAAPLQPASVRLLDPSDMGWKSSVTILGEGTYTVDGATGDVLFTPVPTFTGVATPVLYRVADEAGQPATSMLSVTVDPVTPTAAPDTATTPYAHTVNVPLLGNDAPGAPTALLAPGSVQLQDPVTGTWSTSVTVAGVGAYTTRPDGSVDFTPAPGFHGTAPALAYRVADANGTYAASTVTVTVGEPPVASPDSATTPQGLPVTLTPLTNDTAGTGGTLDPASVVLYDPADGLPKNSVTVPNEGTYAVNSTTGDVTFAPLPTYAGVATPITYAVTDSYGNSASSTLGVTVTPVVPVADPDSTTTPYETPVVQSVLGNDTPGDPGVALVPTSLLLLDPADSTWKPMVTLPGVGIFEANGDGTVGFIPAQGYTGTTVALSYRVADANGTLAQSTVQVTVTPPAPPVANPDATTTLQGTAVTLGTLGNDTSAPAAPLNPATVMLFDPLSGLYSADVTIPGEGRYTVDPVTGDVHFVPVPSFWGTATPVTYHVADEAGQLATSTISITVTAVTPTALPDTATTPYSHSVTVSLSGNDSAGDPTIPLVPASLQLQDPVTGTWGSSVTVGGVGTYTADGLGGVTFVPAAGYIGTAPALPYRIADANGTYATSTLTVTVQAPPHASPDTATTLQGQPVTVAPLGNDTPGGTASLVPSSVELLDPADGTWKATVTVPGEGAYVVNSSTGMVDFIPLPAFSGVTAPLAYRSTDTDGNPASSTITITVTAVTPTALPDNGSTPYAQPVTVPLLANDSPGDPVVPLSPTSVQFRDPVTSAWGSSVSVSGVGTYVANPDGSVTYSPAAGFTGTAPALDYRVADANGTYASSTVSIVVGAAPVAANDSATTLQNQPVTLHPLSNDQPGTAATLVPSSVQLVDPGSGLFVPLVTVPNEGTYTVDPVTGDVLFTPVAWFGGSASPVTYRMADSDGNLASATLSVTVTPVVPNIVADSASTPFRTAVTIPVLANDTAGDPTAPLDPTSVVLEDPADGLWKAGVTIPGQGALVVQPDGSVQFTPDASFQGTVTPILYRVTDANGTRRTAPIDVVVGNAPVAAADSATTPQGQSVTLPLLGNDSPGTGGTLDPASVRLVDPTDGSPVTTVTISGEGDWTVDPVTGSATFAPLPSFIGDATPISYTVTDSFGNSATAVASVKVVEVVPTAVDDTATTPFRTPVTVPVLANDTAGRADTPLDPTTVELQDPATGTWGTTVTVIGVGVWTVETDGSVAFTPDTAFDGVTDPLPYRVADINGTYAPATLVVTVNPPYGAAASPDTASAPSGVDTVTFNPILNDTPSHGAEWVPGSVCLMPDTAGRLTGAAVTCAKTATVAGVGTWVVNPDGTVTFTAATGFTGVATIGYTVTDTNGVTVTNVADVTISLLPNTGGPSITIGVLGVLLLLVGGLALVLGRRRDERRA